MTLRSIERGWLAAYARCASGSACTAEPRRDLGWWASTHCMPSGGLAARGAAFERCANSSWWDAAATPGLAAAAFSVEGDVYAANLTAKEAFCLCVDRGVDFAAPAAGLRWAALAVAACCALAALAQCYLCCCRRADEGGSDGDGESAPVFVEVPPTKQASEFWG